MGKFALHLSKKIFKKDIDQLPTRQGYGEGLVEAATKNKNIVALCCDLTDSTKTAGFAEKFPDRFIEVGVAEQNMLGIGAGLALSGKIPFVSSYAVFNPGRNWDQIRVSAAYSKANVKIMGAHAGISVGPDGATHQALEDMAITRALPNMTVIAPADYIETKKATIALASHVGPAYMRFAREPTPIFTSNSTPFKIGRAEVYKEGKDVTIIAAGPVVYEALKAAKQLKIDAEVINSHTIKPLDTKTILKSARKTGAVVTLEEHQIIGALGSAVAETLVENYPVPMKRVGVMDRFGESGQPNELLDKFGLTAKTVVKRVNEVMRMK